MVYSGFRLLQDIPQPIHICPFYWVWLEKVVLLKLHTARFQGLRVFAGPDLLLGLFQHRRTILDNESESRVEMRELDAEASCMHMSIDDASTRE